MRKGQEGPEEQRLPNYIRMHRRRTGLTQHELEEVLGYRNGGPVALHERFQATPPLKAAIGYEIVFRVPVAELFPGIRDTLSQDIEARLAALEESLGRCSAKDRNATAIARKLTWLAERNAIDYVPFP